MSTTDLYHRTEDEYLQPQTHTRGVVYWREDKREAVQFLCPCGQRPVYVTSPPHKIDFSSDGTLLGLGGSCGYKARPELDRPANWCHFTITDGVPSMHDDSKCQNGNRGIP